MTRFDQKGIKSIKSRIFSVKNAHIYSFLMVHYTNPSYYAIYLDNLLVLPSGGAMQSTSSGLARLMPTKRASGDGRPPRGDFETASRYVAMISGLGSFCLQVMWHM